MSRRSIPPVEALSPEAWSRIEQGVFERLDRLEQPEPQLPLVARARTFTTLALVAGTLALAASLVLWIHGSAVTEPPLAATNSLNHIDDAANAVVEAKPSAEPRAAPELRRIAGGARLETFEAAERVLVNDSEITLAKRSRLSVHGSDAHGWELRLEGGRVDCHVAPRAARPEFVTRAGDVEVRVVGTRFSVEHDAAGTRVNVQEGKVRVMAPGARVLLGAGERWVSPGADDPASSRTSARPKRSTAPTDRARFERATRLESLDPGTALTIYRELSRHRGPWAANALYASGRLELERGNIQQARSLLSRYLKRYPRGANVRDAETILARTR